MFTYPIDIGSPDGKRWERIEAAVGAGSAYTVVPEALLQRLGVSPSDEVLAVLPNGHHAIRRIGQAHVRVAGREDVALVVFGTDEEEAVLGDGTLTGLFLGVDPAHRRLVALQVPPDSKEGTTQA